MKLTFVSENKSVKKFDELEIQDFSVFTGKNGSGKTHFLNSIKDGDVEIEGIAINEILYLNYSNFVQNFQVSTNYSHKVDAWNRLQDSNNIAYQLKRHENAVNPYKETIENIAKEKNKPIFLLKEEDFNGESNPKEFINAINSYKNELISVLNQDNYKGDDLVQSIYESVICRSNVFLSSISINGFYFLFEKTSFGGRSILSDISSIFLAYYRKYKRNLLDGIDKKGSVSDSEFFEINGEPPWKLIRNIFTGFNIPFNINDPEQEQTEPFDGTFTIKFFNTERNNKEIPFSDLSSGEQILITLVNSIYTAQRKNNLPKLLLLDEIDGPLNPSIIENFLNYILRNFVDKGIRVILATHSPSTVAFAPDDSIYIVNTIDDLPVKNVLKSEAINTLSEGFITLNEGINLFDQISKTKISIITEGKNTLLLKKGIELYGLENIEVVVGCEGISGWSQIKTLFDFFSVVQHDKKIFFVWDCDVNSTSICNPFTERNNTIPYIFDKNNSNLIAKKGIENLFSQDLLNNFKKTTSFADGNVIEQFDENQKRHFEEFIINRNNKDDFVNFEPLFKKIKEELDNTTNVQENELPLV